MSEKVKPGIWFWVFWIGLVVLAYGLVTFSTAIASPEAAETAGTAGVYGSLAVFIIGIIMTVIGYLKKK